MSSLAHNTKDGFFKVVFNKKPEKIIGATNASGQLIYLMKWKGIPEADLISAEKANVMCPQIVIKFLQDTIICTDESDKSDLTENNDYTNSNNVVNNVSEVYKKPEQIYGGTKRSGHLQYLMKWKGIEEPELISAEEANSMCPQIVIEFHQERLEWSK